jgi:hypothetical protein
MRAEAVDSQKGGFWSGKGGFNPQSWSYAAFFMEG